MLAVTASSPPALHLGRCAVGGDRYLSRGAWSRTCSARRKAAALAQLTLHAELIGAAPDHATWPSGMIVSKLVTNSLKYAYPEDKKGAIRVALRRDGDKPRPAHASKTTGVGNSLWRRRARRPPRPASGQRIVHAMGDKLHARIDHDSSPSGARVIRGFDPSIWSAS